jgi:lysozyme
MFNFNSQHPVVRAAKQPASWIVIAVTCVSLFEGLYTHPYYDVVGVKTVCYGATAADHVDLNRNYTPDECKAILASDLPKYDAMLQKCLTPVAYKTLPPYRHAAMVSFVYNVGPGNFCKSSVAKDLNAGNPKAACDALLLFNRAGGRVIKGLVNRRNTERTMCERDD